MSSTGHTIVRLLSGLIWLCSLTLLVVVLLPFEPVRARLDAVAGDGSADLYTPAVHARFRCGAALLLILATGCGLWLMRCREHLGPVLYDARLRCSRDRQRTSRRLGRLVRIHAGWLALVTLLAAGLRLHVLDQPMRYDESHTFIKYASMPIPLIVTRYDEPNNHILHSIGVRVSTLLLGDSPTAIRLTALLCGLLLAPLVLLWGADTLGRSAGILAGSLVAINSQLIEFSVNARGYTLAALLFAVACWSARTAVRQRNLWAACIAVVSTALCLWTVPTMILGIVPLVLWLLLAVCARTPGGSRLREVSPVLAGIIAAGLLTAILYLPVLLAEGPSRLMNIGGPQQLVTNSLAMLPEGAVQVVEWMLRDVPAWLNGLLGLGLLLALIGRGRVCRHNRCVAGCAMAGVVAVLLVLRVVPPLRVWLFAIPPVFLLAASGGWRMVPRFRERGPRWRRWLPAIVTLPLITAATLSLLDSESIRTSDQTGSFPEAEPIITALQPSIGPDEPIIAITPASAPLVYYARRHGLAASHFMPASLDTAAPTSAIVVTSRDFEQSSQDVLQEFSWTDHFAPQSATVLQEFPTAIVYRMSATRD